MGYGDTAVLDNFNRASLGSDWSTLFGTPQITSNEFAGGGTSNNIAIWRGAGGTFSTTNGLEAYATVTTKDSTNGRDLIMALSQPAGSQSLANIDGYQVQVTTAAGDDDWVIQRITNGAPTTLASSTQEISAGDRFGLTLQSDGTLAAWIDTGSGPSTVLTATDSTYTGTFEPAINIENTTWRLDDYGGGEYVQPSMTLETGAYTVTGATSDLLAARLLDMDAGGYTVTGNVTDLLATRVMNLETGSYLLTGNTADLLAQRVLDMDAGSYTVAGAAVDLLISRTLSLETGSYAVTGNTAGLLAGRLITLETGSYALSGNDAALIAGRVLELETGSYAVTGNNTALLVSRVINLETGAYTVTGQALTFDLDESGNPIIVEARPFTVTAAARDLLVTPG